MLSGKRGGRWPVGRAGEGSSGQRAWLEWGGEGLERKAVPDGHLPRGWLSSGLSLPMTASSRLHLWALHQHLQHQPTWRPIIGLPVESGVLPITAV